MLILDLFEARLETAIVEILTLLLTSLTATGAILAARAATRQARVAEMNLAEQGRNAWEQAERQRLSLKVDLILKLDERFGSESFLETRRRASLYIKDQFFLGDGPPRVEYLNNAGADVLNFMETLGYLVKHEAIDIESVWERFGHFSMLYWTVCEPAVRNVREKQKSPWVWQECENLNAKMIRFVYDRYGDTLTFPQEYLRGFVEAEAVIGTDEGQTDRWEMFRS